MYTLRLLCTMLVGWFCLTGCAHTNLQVGSRPAIIPPQIDGTIASIRAGNPSYVILKDVTDMGNNTHMTHKSTDKITLPAGRFVSSDHWQSDGDTLDLFIGDGFTLMKGSGRMIDTAPDPGFAGVIQSVNSKQMVVRKVLYDTTSRDSHAMKFTNDTVTIHLAPYTFVTSNGQGSMPASQMRVDNAVLFILIGPPSEYIATQVTCFANAATAGWHMEN